MANIPFEISDKYYEFDFQTTFRGTWIYLPRAMSLLISPKRVKKLAVKLYRANI